MSLEAMGPILGALTVAPLIVAFAGFSAPFIVLVAGVAMGVVAFVIARFTRVLPSAASIYTYISHGLGERWGFMSTWLSFIYYFLFPPSLMIGMGLYGASLSAVRVPHPHRVVLVVDHRRSDCLRPVDLRHSPLDAQWTSRSRSSPTSCCSRSRSGIIVSVIGKGHFTFAPLLPTHAKAAFTGLSLSIAFGVLIFLGYEQSFVLGEEVEDPHRDVPKAIFVALDCDRPAASDRLLRDGGRLRRKRYGPPLTARSARRARRSGI